MNGKVHAALVAMLLAACRSPGAANDAAAAASAPRTAEATALSVKSAKLTAIRTQTGPAGQPLTQAVLTYDLGCGETLEAFSSAVMRKGRGAAIYAAALASTKTGPGDEVYRCTDTQRTVEKTVDLDVAAKESDVQVINLHLAPTDLPFEQGRDGLEPLVKGSITRVEPLCPGAPESCPKNGTFATVTLTGPCYLSDGPSGYFIEPSGNDMFTLVVAAFGLPGSPKATCTTPLTQSMNLLIPMQSLPGSSLSLIVLK